MPTPREPVVGVHRPLDLHVALAGRDLRVADEVVADRDAEVAHARPAVPQRQLARLGHRAGAVRGGGGLEQVGDAGQPGVVQVVHVQRVHGGQPTRRRRASARPEFTRVPEPLPASGT